MRPLVALEAQDARALRGVLFDLDDTLLSHGTLTREAYGALWDLRDAGLRLVAVTGRPSGWGEVLARQWPVDGAVTENGGVLLLRGRGGVLDRVERCDEAERRSRRIRLGRLVEEARSVVPEARLSDDVDARRTDVTWDIGERVRLPVDRVDMLARLIVERGARTTRSSVHLHATFDTDDKASGAVHLLGRAFGEDAGSALRRYAFVGDSGNDAACFASFTTTFGVKNVEAHLARLVVAPAYVASRPMGEGFAEISARILALRDGLT